ncbi:MAG: metal-dependent transcriptional regulator [Bacteroidota bacterium]
MLTYTEENYLKAIFQLQEDEKSKISTNSIAERLSTTPATVSDMLQKLSAKKMVNYLKYYGVSLTAAGKKKAINVVRKHRLWELFLYEKLGFNWDEVHEVAEQMEHIQSDILVQKLYDFLDKPKTDPHGDPIPDENGVFPDLKTVPLAVVDPNKEAVVIGVSDHRPDFLQYLQKIGVKIGKKLNIIEVISFDKSMDISIEGSRKSIHISHDAAKSIMVNLV